MQQWWFAGYTKMMPPLNRAYPVNSLPLSAFVCSSNEGATTQEVSSPGWLRLLPCLHSTHCAQSTSPATESVLPKMLEAKGLTVCRRVLLYDRRKSGRKGGTERWKDLTILRKGVETYNRPTGCNQHKTKRQTQHCSRVCFR